MPGTALSGTVQDSTAAVIPGATVQIDGNAGAESDQRKRRPFQLPVRPERPPPHHDRRLRLRYPGAGSPRYARRPIFGLP